MKAIYSIRLSSLLLLNVLLFCFTGLQAQSNNLQSLVGANRTITASLRTERFQWIGTDSGLYRINLRNNSLTLYTKSNSALPDNQINAIAARSNGDVFFATNNGLLRFYNFSFLPMNTENSKLPSNHITALLTDAQDRLWIGSSDNGLACLDGNHMSRYNRSNSLPQDNQVCTILQNGMGEIYFGLCNSEIWMKYADNNFYLVIGDISLYAMKR